MNFLVNFIGIFGRFYRDGGFCIFSYYFRIFRLGFCILYQVRANAITRFFLDNVGLGGVLIPLPNQGLARLSDLPPV